jgi:NAD(P)-dependent dehydrogenase (short-subunit alcohol dehydrogenase family)
MDLNLTGKTVLITGGSKGLGLATALRFACEGCDLHLAARSEATLEAAADTIRAAYPVKVTTLAIDLARPGFATRVADACGDVDILVNNAGDVPSGSLESVDEARWRAGWDSKVFNYINLSREYFARMKTRRSGVIVNVIGISGDLLDASYIAGSVGNAAMAAFTKALGSTSHKFGVRVVGVSPGPCATERNEKLGRAKALERHGDPERWREAQSTLPFGRPATPDEIAAAVVFLASPRSAYTTGSILTIDGGLSGGREIAR